ncbi:hypothetical protein [Staphylococcus epidermidis]|nr:hypothetical protein [Staphylococcus epidermidis]
MRGFGCLIDEGKRREVWNIDMKDEDEELMSVMGGRIGIKGIE